jgi:hypothetical protein
VDMQVWDISNSMHIIWTSDWCGMWRCVLW